MPAGVMPSDEQAAELRAVLNSRDVPAGRARIVLWLAEGRRHEDVGGLARMSLPVEAGLSHWPGSWRT